MVVNKLCVLFILLAFASTVLSQSIEKDTDQNEMSLAVNYIPILSQYTPSFQIELNHIYRKKYFTGLYFTGGASTTSSSFGYTIESPIVNYMSIGWQNGLKLLNRKNFALSASISNNLGIIRLGDNAFKHTSYNGKAIVTSSKEIATDYCYTLLPKIEMSQKIWRTLHLYGGVGYQYNIGKTFTDIKSFNGFAFSLGIQLKFD